MTEVHETSDAALPVFGLKEYLAQPETIIPHLNEPAGGFILLDKPYALPSFNGVHRVRKLLSDYSGEKKVKVGHGGTLDPLATGLLIVATRKATKRLNQLLFAEKTYEVTIRFGVTSPSYDLETPITVLAETDALDPVAIRDALSRLPGEHDQVPPIYSAVKIKGKPVYKHARKGRTLELAPKKIIITNVTMLDSALPYARFSVTCSKGTYIRSLAHDLGMHLGVGAVVTSLRRTQIGEFDVRNALTFEMLYDLRSSIKRRL